MVPFPYTHCKMSKLQKTFGIRDEESPCELDIEDQKCAYRIGMRVEHTCNRTPWQSKCLVKALTASHLLKKRGISHTLYLGVGQNDSKMIAHAWLRSGRLYVTGGNGATILWLPSSVINNQYYIYQTYQNHFSQSSPSVQIVPSNTTYIKFINSFH